MIRNAKYVTDGATTLLGGVDESRQPLLLKPDQVSRAINVTMRGGFPRTRPAFMRAPLEFARGEYGQWFIENVYQGSLQYDDFMGMEKAAVSVGGRIFLIDVLGGWMVTEITPKLSTVTTANFTADATNPVVVTVSDASLIFDDYPIYINGVEYVFDSKSGNNITLTNRDEINGTVVNAGAVVEFLDPNSPLQPLAWFEQAEQYLIIQDDQSAAIIFDGSSSRRAKPGVEIPSGSEMAFGRGRLWVAVNNGREFVAGDIAGGPTGVLAFTENTYLSGGGAFRIGANVGRIRAMKFIMNLDTSLGQGPLQVLCDRAIYSVNAPTSRELWAVVTDPIQTESLINFGARGQYSTVLVNGDMFFRAEDGVRSFFVARRDFGMWGNTPISREMSKILDKDTSELLGSSAGCVFDNRLLMTCVPQPCTNGVKHKGVIVLDFDLISTLGDKSPPAYDGFWTGVDVLGFVTGNFASKKRCLVFAAAPSGGVVLYELTTDGRMDNGRNQIGCVLEYRSFSFPRAGGVSGLKRLEGAEVWVSEFAGQVDFTLTYKPDQDACWQDWAQRTICVTSDQCDETDPCDSTPASSNMLGFKTRVGFGKPADTANDADEKAMRFAYNYQARLAWDGYAALSRFVLYAHEEEEWPTAPPSDERSECSAIACCPPNPFEYGICCSDPQPPIVINDGDGIQMFFWYEGCNPDAAYTIYVQTEDDGQQVLAEFPPDDDDSFVAPNGWYSFSYPTLTDTLPSLQAGDTVRLWIQSTACDYADFEGPSVEFVFDG